MNSRKILFVIGLLCLLVQCQFAFQPSPPITIGANLPYNLNQVDGEIKLGPELDEISGLTYDPKENVLLAVNDEQGVIFSIKAEPVSVTPFELSGDADFEGVELVDDIIYLLKSDGDLFMFNKEGVKIDKIENGLSASNDVEGLGFYPEKRLLLLACKGKAELKDKKEIKHAKAVYSFDIDKEELKSKPYVIVTDEGLDDFIDLHYRKGSLISKNDLEKRVRKFSPSGIAVHRSGDIYILSDSGKMILVLRDKEIYSVHFLDSSVHQKPEGICFNAEADLFISNEGKGGKARILKYKVKK